MGLPANSKTLTIPHFLDGLNTIQDSTQIKDTEVQLLDDMEVRPLNYSSEADDGSGISKLALSARGSYKTLHSDILPFTPKNLIEFQQSSGAVINYYTYVDDPVGAADDGSTYLYTTASSSGERAMFSFAVFAVAGAITSLQIIIRAKASTTSGTPSIAAKILVNGLYYSAADQALTTSWATYTFTWATNPKGGGAWTAAEINGAGVNPLQFFGFNANTGGGGSIKYVSQVYAHAIAGGGNQDRLPTGDNSITDSWKHTFPETTVTGTKSIFSGGYNQSSGNYEVRQLIDNNTTTILTKATASIDTGRANFFTYNQYLFYTDGNVAWRKYDGITESASGFVTKTKTGTIHKDRAWYGNDVTNNLTNYVYYSSVGLPETVNALNFFRVGDQNDSIVNLVDMQDHLLIIKEKTVWALYVSADLTNSILIRKNKSKGSPAPLGAISTDKGVILYTSNSGTQRLPNNGTGIVPVFIPVLNLIRGTIFDTTGAFGYIQDQVWFATRAIEPLDSDARIFMYDTLANKVYKNNLDISCFLSDDSSSTFNGWPKACLTSGYIIELDHVNDASEATVVAYMRTKDFTFDLLPYKKKISCIILDWNAPDTSSNLTVRTWCDSAVKETFTENATQEGYNRTAIDCRPDLSRGHKISIDVSFPQKYADPLVTERFAILSMTIIYTVENRID